ncbi:DUF4367 domain-containing protein [Oceanirhabdus seepicola]|uniref:DUF4367 domain-containing protein n=1 Tax=Oceanirhabdus seepicola TaxID=2828781 RepID=A0A9J6NXK2_9CLOT|nr:DUF4367 domain-containing protein [Oceanirhabdus seepicola]MCM1989239.1 hypothetical protein [Oceanirhabdus seepicola]
MKKDNIEHLIEESLEEYEETMELEGMIIPEFNETMNKVKNKINKEDNENEKILLFKNKGKRREGFMKKQVKKYVAVAAMLSILVVGGGVYSFMGNNVDGTKPSITDNGGVQIPSPWVNGDSVEEVERECGFEIEEFTYLPDGFNKSEIVYLKTDEGVIVRQFARNSTDERISFEKRNNTIENDGDYTVYDKENTINVVDVSVTVKYEGENLKKAQWEKDDFKYSIMSDNTIKIEDMVKIIEGVKY